MVARVYFYIPALLFFAALALPHYQVATHIAGIIFNTRDV